MYCLGMVWMIAIVMILWGCGDSLRFSLIVYVIVRATYGKESEGEYIDKYHDSDYRDNQ